jgi:hypothetical protein
MVMPANLRKFALMTHVTSSVGWLGAVAAFLALAIVGVVSSDVQLVRGVYLAMHPITWVVIVPMGFVAFLTGIVQSIGTPWGLFRHYWVVTKLRLTVIATTVLLLHTQPIDRVAAAVALMPLPGQDLWQLRVQLVGDASAALFVLFATTTLSVYKPWGMTPYGLRKQYEDATATSRLMLVSDRFAQRGRPGRYVVLAIIGFVLLIVLLHLAGVGLHEH